MMKIETRISSGPIGKFTSCEELALVKVQMMSLISFAKRTVKAARISAVEFYGHIDAMENEGFLRGWAQSAKTPHIPVQVKCILKGKTVGPVLALDERPDVLEVHGTSSTCGFSINLRPVIDSLKLRKSDYPISVDVFVGYQDFSKLGNYTIAWPAAFGVFQEFDSEKIKKLSALCAKILLRVDAENRSRARELPFFSDIENSAESAAVLKRPVRTIVEPTASPLTLRVSQGKKLLLSNYVDQQRYRFNVDRSFRVELADAETDRFLKWYIEAYGPIRGWRRAPLSKREIDYLNGPSLFPVMSRVMAFFIPPHLLEQCRESEEFRRVLAYWWAVDEAPKRHIEDCLVPEWCQEILQKCRREMTSVPFPLSNFMERFFFDMKSLHFLDLANSSDRLLFYFFLVIYGVESPSIFRFLPPVALRLLLNMGTSEEDTGKDIFGLIHEVLGITMLPSENVPRLIRERMFDLKTMKFVTLSADGDRILSAAFRTPSSLDEVDVQLIGPLSKASGLGQAARLSAGMLAQTGVSVSMFDFGMDNPAPEGYSSVSETGKLKKSKINIVHLNGESAQLAFAYMPDVYSSAYNIGYFYWELDTPAACHHLSIELLDEIWVSSEYCREIYASATSKPVINVGMCAEKFNDSSRRDAQEFLRSKIRSNEGDFVFLSAFDSFSFVQRKNPIGVIHAFRSAFPDDGRVRLVLKTHNRSLVQDPQQLRIWAAVDEEMSKDHRITLLDETLPYQDLRKLKAGVDCYVSLHRSEGWGFGMIEAMASSVPVIATSYSGNLDFCKAEHCWLVDYDLVSLYPDDYIFVVPGQQWAEPRLTSAVEQMRSVAYDHEERQRRVQAASAFVQQNFNESVIAKRYGDRLREVLACLTTE